jgi:alpha-L-fucosidase
MMRLQASLISLSVLLMLVLVPTPVHAADNAVSWLPGETVAQKDARMAWFRQAKFGMFIHWGIYSVAAKGEWYMRSQQISVAEYSRYARQFNPVKFDADEWAALAHDAGMKYMVFTTKHHDGFAMFKSAATPYNIVEATPFNCDVVKELADACPRHGIRFGTYYSFLSDWGHKGGGAGGPHWDPAGQDGDLHDYIRDIAMPQIKELLSNYGPLAVMWFDGDGASGMTPAEAEQVIKLLKIQPRIVVDPRLAGVKGDFASAEVDAPILRPKGDWELCGSVSASWGYTVHIAKPLSQLLPYIINVWGLGGNMLLNVGPSPDGVIPEDQVARLREVGTWLHTYGDSIYGSTAGPFDYLPWGTATRKGSTLYLQIFKWPSDGHLRVPLSNTVKKATLLGPDGPRELTIGHDGSDRLIVYLPSSGPDAVANVVALTIEGEPETDYRSVLLNAPVTASAAQGSAANAVDDDPSTVWNNPQTTGWLEFNLPKPATVTTLRMTTDYTRINNFGLDYKDGEVWKPILKAEKTDDHFAAKAFAPVTARTFRLNILESEKAARIGVFALYPPL